MQDTYSVKELMARYKCARSTIFNMMNKKGYPRGGSTMTRASSISGEAIADWEKVHMPWLHPRPKTEDEVFEQEDHDRWNGPDGVLAQRDKVIAQAKQVEKVKPETRSWQKVRNAAKKKMVKIRTRHGR